ncbi:KedN5 family methylcobalamin-dependent radical SAM C-methyltransferase [Streptomyces sp. NPDC050560]|uniref:KedN5 family methylcobalamin-dependent radical SAM C-methyltransferase n=1 Tax=Streptomyces sp. NPDC050560 TaxID=3365630 RepID=UPI0037BD3CE6
MEKTPKKKVLLIQQGVWAMSLESMPLASAYIKATALDDQRIRDQLDIEIRNFDGGATLVNIAQELFGKGDVPDVIAFSVLGWNFRTFGCLAETFKQLNPDGWVVFGGTHVAHQAARTLRMYPEVDVVVNGEGELTFREVLNAYLDGTSRHELDHIQGISFTDGGDKLVTTEERPRIEDLDVIPSPFLTGAISLTDENGEFPYDVALLETNRGCPYKCAFCFWGGAVGQRVRAFSRERLRQELELFARHKVHTIVLCDANFGMLPIDREFVEDMIEVRDKYGFPRALETSWAKNKSKLFYDIVRMMKEAGLHSSFTLALQTLDESALSLMNRRNMKVNSWEELAEWLNKEGMECYAELIWGAPGETVESFMNGYDRLAKYVTRVATYPMLLLPNTEYSENKEKYGLLTVRGDQDDFEYLLKHQTMTPQDNELIHRFLFFSRLTAENPVFRSLWTALRVLGGVTQSQAIRSMIDWFGATQDPEAEPIQDLLARSFTNVDALGPATEFVYGRVAAKRLFQEWWQESMRPRVPEEHRALLDEVFRYDIQTLPAYVSGGEEASELFPHPGLPVVTVAGERFHVRAGMTFRCDVPALVQSLKRDEPYDHALVEFTTSLYYKVGVDGFVGSTNHEEIIYFMGRLEREMDGTSSLAATGAE